VRFYFPPWDTYLPRSTAMLPTILALTHRTPATQNPHLCCLLYGTRCAYRPFVRNVPRVPAVGRAGYARWFIPGTPHLGRRASVPPMPYYTPPPPLLNAAAVAVPALDVPGITCLCADTFTFLPAEHRVHFRLHTTFLTVLFAGWFIYGCGRDAVLVCLYPHCRMYYGRTYNYSTVPCHGSRLLGPRLAPCAHYSHCLLCQDDGGPSLLPGRAATSRHLRLGWFAAGHFYSARIPFFRAASTTALTTTL